MSETVVLARGWESFCRAHRLDSVAAVFERTDGVVIKSGRGGRVLRLALRDGETTRVVFLKSYRVAKLKQWFGGIVRGGLWGPSKVRTEFESLGRLRALGLDAPAPVAYGEERRAGWLVRSFLVSESAPDPISLDLFIRDELSKRPLQEQQMLRRRLIEGLAEYTARMHRCRFAHQDYYWRNILLCKGSWEHFHLIDAHKGHEWAGEGEEDRAGDLAALDAPAPWFFRRAERLRFFLRYAGRARLEAEDKPLLRRVLWRAEAERQRELHRVRKALPPPP